MKVAALLSGGKDSVAAIHTVQQWGWEVSVACVLQVTGSDSHMFHRPNTRWAPLIAEAMGLPCLVGETQGEKERELDDLEALLVRARDDFGVDGVVSGALASEYQRTRIERIGHRLGLKTFTPLWHKEPHAYLRGLVDARFHVHFVAVAAEGLGPGWLGRKLTERALLTLERQADRFGIHVAGEGGEYETLVVEGPCFRRPLLVQSSQAHWQRDAGWWEVEQARLGPERDETPDLQPE